MDDTLKAHEKRSDRLEDKLDTLLICLGSIDNRVGPGMENAVAGALRICLGRKGIEAEDIKLRQKVTDVRGILGFAGRSYEIDLVVSNGETWLFKVKLEPDVEDVERFSDKAEMAIATVPLPGARKMLITLTCNDEIRQTCARLGIVFGSP